MSTSKIYTRTGDKGKTSLIGGSRVSKSHLRLDAYGTVDELNSWMGVLRRQVRVELSDVNLKFVIDHDLEAIQNSLFSVGSLLACEDNELRTKLPPLKADTIAGLEARMDEFSAALAPLKNFILPGGASSACSAHVARTVCRRAERLCVALGESGHADENDDLVRYLNRLSDFLFVLARRLNASMEIEEPIWKS